MTAAITIDDRQALHDLREFAEVGDSVGVLNILAAHRIQARKEAIEEAAAYLDKKAEWLAEDGMAGTYRGAIEDLRRDAAAIRALTTE